MSGWRTTFIAGVVPVLALLAVGCGSSRDGDALVANVGDLGHVHDIVVDDDTVFLAAHTGLFKIEGTSRAVLVGEFRHDFMSMTSGPNGLVASGHPDLRFDEWRVPDMPAHLGFVTSDDLGATWDKTALLGQVDFHSLTTRIDDGFYGADSAGTILASRDGLSWDQRSSMYAIDLAASPRKPDTVLAIDAESGELRLSTDGARSWETLADAPPLVRVQWHEEVVVGIAADGAIYSVEGPRNEWTKITELGDEPVAFTSRDGEWWVVTEEASVLHSDNSMTFRTIYEPPDRPSQ